ncbi:MAG: hypothetical protein CL666_01055 [Balneola sp.]|nr:hypothetical protein [Balneola sp.]|tara:strand:+ start:55822 stop:56679 length:858 start_codon:yes stop_codon:yes gene_type:complete
MKTGLLPFVLFMSFMLTISGCDKEVSLNPRLNKVIHFVELPEESFPPCLSHGGIGFQMAISSNSDYEKLRRDYAPQGEYEYFVAGDNPEPYQLSYQPLDTNGDHEIGPEDIVIYARARPFRITYQGELYRVNSIPFYIYDDSLSIYYEDDPYTTAGKIHYENVLSIHPSTGAVEFKKPLSVNTRVSMSANKLYSSYDGRTCSMENFDFSRGTIIGKKVTGNGCLNGFDKQISIESQNKQIIYSWWKDEDHTSNGCPSIALSYESWVQIIPPPPGFDIVFEERVLQ